MHIGIDLGTTFCCVSYINEGIPEVIRDNFGRISTPSVISFDGKTAYVGEEANKKKIGISSLIFECFKRDMGIPIDVGNSKSEKSIYEVKGIKYGAIGMSAILLRKLKKDVWRFFKNKEIIADSISEKDFIIDTVISVPAYFGDLERQATKCAGELAGFNVIGIINEPTAASLTYGFSNTEDKKILVFDLGGGTFDVTILEIENGEFNVIGSGGANNLGGKDWDEIIEKYIESEYRRISGNEIPIERTWEIQEKSVQAKIQLSDNQETIVYLTEEESDIEIKLHASSLNKDKLFDMDFDKDENKFYFDERCSDKLSVCSSICIQVLEKASLNWEDIDEIVLAGGSCRMPMIPGMLEKISGKKIKKHREGFSYDTAIAIGAAIYGQSRGKIQDVTPKSIGIKLTKEEKEYIDYLIYKNTPLPAKKQKKYNTDAYAVLEVYEGESKELDLCVLRGKLQLENTQEFANIILEVDENGILKVLADYQPEGIKETKISGGGYCPEHLKDLIQSINIIS